MLIKELCAKCALTKKAVEYYTEQGLLFPALQANGYRIFSDDDVIQAKKIAVLRKLDLSIDEIKTFFSSTFPNNELSKIAYQRDLNIQLDIQKRKLLEQLYYEGDFEKISTALTSIEQNKLISQKLLEFFPGYLGGFFSLHFSSFLNEPIVTDYQQHAFDVIVNFLDNIPDLTISEDLQVYINEMTTMFSTQSIKQMTTSMKESLEKPTEFLESTKDELKEYIRWKNTDEYRDSIVNKLSILMREFCSTSGYYDIFIAAMRALSSDYNSYQIKLEAMNQQVTTQFPEVLEWTKS